MRDDTPLSVVNGDASRTHGERLPEEIERALALARVGVRELDLLVVASGPGAFTGLRIGLAAMQGLAMVLQKPVVGVSALDVLAQLAARDRPPSTCGIVTWMDAQRGEVFGAAYTPLGDDGVDLARGPSVGAPAVLLAEVPFAVDEEVVFAGDGAVRYADAIRDLRGSRARILVQTVPLAPTLARRGRAMAAAGAAGPPHALKPLYVRRPDAERDRDLACS